MRSFIRSKEFLLGLAILCGVAGAVMTKTGVFQNISRHTLVSADESVKTVANDPDKPNASPNTIDGYAVVDKNTPIYVVETEEDNSIKCASGHYVDNKRVGLWEFYYPNGMLKASGSYKDNQKDGMWKYLYASNQLMSTGRYFNGEMTGTWISYYINGNRKSEGQCKGSIQIGLWLLWPDESRSDCYWRGVFNSVGKMDGEWKYYENGTTVRTVIYNNGKVTQ